MTNKEDSELNGIEFVRRIYSLEQQLLALKLEFSLQSVTHSGKMGEVNENHFLEFLRRYLPKRYEVSSGIIIDSRGQTSHQLDIVIYDNQYTPTLAGQNVHMYIPAEAVYCVIEAKPEINKANLEYACDKALSVQNLYRTSVPIAHAGGIFKAKEPFGILYGIVAARWGWKTDPKDTIQNVFSNKKVSLNFGLALDGDGFDYFDEEFRLSPKEHSLVYITFRLLKKLQSLGTVSAIDWDEYANAISGVPNEVIKK